MRFSALLTSGPSLSPTQHTNDFALYTEAIKFFNHPESMVRIAVRTITLNVYKGECRGPNDEPVISFLFLEVFLKV